MRGSGIGDGPTGIAPVLEVLDPGFLTTIQDGGRPGLGSLGVPHGGAADPRSLAVANLLVGNPPGTPALECTIVGPTFRLLAPTTVALAGADLGAHVVDTGEGLRNGTARHVRAGWSIALPGPPRSGSRAYLALPGGILVPPVLGSASTLVGARFGGLDGRALRPGDVLSAGPGRPAPAADWPDEAVASAAAASLGGTAGEATTVLRVVAGPDTSTGVGAATGADLATRADAIDALAATTWRVDPRSDRQGLRLDGPPLPGSWTGDRATIAVLPGAIQVPPDGKPIALLVDAQPTGGYPVPAVVIRADLPRLGQLAPGDTVRFAVVSAPDARAILRASVDAFETAAARLRDATRWDELWHGAGDWGGLADG